jgi:uncharacterized UBP type Zn finger protein
MQINDNTMNLAQYRGEVRACPLCSNRTPNAALDALTSGKVCKLCLGHKFVAICLNCGGTGQCKGRSVWDGGRSEHTSTCMPCGGSGVFPVNRPENWADPAPNKTVETAPASV